MLENEFDIKMEGDRKEFLKSMCNLSQGIFPPDRFRLVFSMHFFYIFF